MIARANRYGCDIGTPLFHDHFRPVCYFGEHIQVVVPVVNLNTSRAFVLTAARTTNSEDSPDRLGPGQVRRPGETLPDRINFCARDARCCLSTSLLL